MQVAASTDNDQEEKQKVGQRSEKYGLSEMYACRAWSREDR